MIEQNNEFTKVLIMSDDHIYDDPKEIKAIEEAIGFNPFVVENTLKIIELVQPQVVFHNGDISLKSAYDKLNKHCKDINISLHYVPGNWDSWEKNPLIPVNIVTIKGSPESTKIFQFHSRNYWNSKDKNNFKFDFMWEKLKKDYPLSSSADIILTGDIHTPVIETKDGKLLLNPGSLNYDSHWTKLPNIGNFMVLNINNKDKSKSYVDLYSIRVNSDKKLVYDKVKSYKIDLTKDTKLIK